MMKEINRQIFRLIYAGIIVLLINYPIYAQDDEDLKEGMEVDIEEVLNGYVSNVNSLLYSNLLFMKQYGNDNHLISVQEQTGFLQNKQIVLQDGTKNYTSSKQSGTQINTLIEQYNSNNKADIISKGENIHVRARQNGNYNKINSYIENDGSSKRSADLLQAGDGNHINLDLRGDGFGSSTEEQWVKITQQGNGHEAIAIKNPFSASFEIEQMPGAGGAGMKVEVSTSDFYFPMK